jgi:hypothetical protein
VHSFEYVPQGLVENMVRFHQQADGQALGCRAMTLCLRQEYNVQVTREAVLQAQRTVEPEGVAARKKQRLQRREYNVAGPNALCISIRMTNCANSDLTGEPLSSLIGLRAYGSIAAGYAVTFTFERARFPILVREPPLRRPLFSAVLLAS